MVKPINKYRVSFEIGSEDYDDLYRWVIDALESTDYHMGIELLDYSIEKTEEKGRKLSD